MLERIGSSLIKFGDATLGTTHNSGLREWISEKHSHMYAKGAKKTNMDTVRGGILFERDISVIVSIFIQAIDRYNQITKLKK